MLLPLRGRGEGEAWVGRIGMWDAFFGGDVDVLGVLLEVELAEVLDLLDQELLDGRIGLAGGDLPGRRLRVTHNGECLWG